MAKIVILGAGLTGLSAAYHLEKNKFNNFEIFEKETEVGGLCRSVKQDGFTFDYTGHLLHINDSYFGQFIDNTINTNNMNNIIRKSFIYSNNTYTKYPFQINLKGQSADVIADCIEEYVKRKPCKKQSKSFYDWVLENFGSGYAKYFFLPFQTKIFDYDIKKITSSWTGRFVPQTSLREMIIGAIKDTDDQIGYNSNFYYPKENGINSWIKNIHKKISKQIKTNFEAEKIDLKNKQILFKNGHVENYDYLITTMPLDQLLEKLKENSSSNLKNSRKYLVCNSVVNFNLGINRQDLSPVILSESSARVEGHWIYFPEHQFPFYRIGFPHNFSDKMTPKNCSSLYGEFSFVNKNKNSVKEILNKSIKKAKQLFDISKNEILTEKVIHIKHAYVIYNFWREKNLTKLLIELKENDVYSIGRYGEWKYSSMQEAVLDGKSIVDKLLIKPAKTDVKFQIEKNENIIELN